MTDQISGLSRYISVILRHRAQDFGLEMDSDGFVDLEGLWALVTGRYGDQYDLDDLQKVIAGDADGKKRFEIVEGRIRALYGHSRVGAVTYPPAEPPEYLYHGTSPHLLGVIHKQGLRPMKRQYVHLSTTIKRAREVGVRQAKWPMVLKIRARQAAAAGVVFHHPEELHWLAKAIPPEFIELPE